MANNYFQFKQFKVDQEGSAMKVCTDSCIFGAWIKEPEAARILDIGTGTGLLSLMLAQNHSGQIDAVEIDKNAFLQAEKNFNSSPFKSQLKAIHKNINSFQTSGNYQYDLIVCNPPFFKNHLKSPDDQRNAVLHDEFLSFEDLINCINRFLSVTGKFYILLPPWQSTEFEKLAGKNGIYPQQNLSIKEKANKDYIRNIVSYSFQKYDPEFHELIIRGSDNHYSSDFKRLLREYYLHL